MQNAGHGVKLPVNLERKACLLPLWENSRVPVKLLDGLGKWKVGAASQSPGLGHCLDQEQGRFRNSLCAEERDVFGAW